MSFDLSSDSSGDGSSVVDFSTLLTKKDNNETRNETKRVSSDLGGAPIQRLDASEDFNFDSDANSEISSVVDVSILVPRTNSKDNNSVEKKSNPSIAGDIPSQSNVGEDRTSEKRNNGDKTHGFSESKQVDGNSVNRISKNSSDSTDDCKQGKSVCLGRMTRIVMGESVKAWRKQRKSAQSRNKAVTENKDSNLSDDDPDRKPPAKYPRYAVVHKKDSSSNSKISRNFVPAEIDFEKSHLNVESGGSGGNSDSIEVTVRSRAQRGSEYTNDENSGREARYTAKKVKRQLLDHEHHMSSSTPISSSTFVDCIAIWDPTRGVYVLEIPELIANDIVAVASSDDNNGDNDRKTVATTSLNNDSRNNGIIDGRHKPALQRHDPLEQQRQAENKLKTYRKRRRS